MFSQIPKTLNKGVKSLEAFVYMLGNSLSKNPLKSSVNKLPLYHSFLLSFADAAHWTVNVLEPENLIHKFSSPRKAN